jgi:hypothetical protein
MRTNISDIRFIRHYMMVIDLFKNLAKHIFPVRYGLSSGELRQMKYITHLHDISIFLSLLKVKKMMYWKLSIFL